MKTDNFSFTFQSRFVSPPTTATVLAFVWISFSMTKLKFPPKLSHCLILRLAFFFKKTKLNKNNLEQRFHCISSRTILRNFCYQPWRADITQKSSEKFWSILMKMLTSPNRSSKSTSYMKRRLRSARRLRSEILGIIFTCLPTSWDKIMSQSEKFFLKILIHAWFISATTQGK